MCSAGRYELFHTLSTAAYEHRGSSLEKTASLWWLSRSKRAEWASVLVASQSSIRNWHETWPVCVRVLSLPSDHLYHGLSLVLDWFERMGRAAKKWAFKTSPAPLLLFCIGGWTSDHVHVLPFLRRVIATYVFYTRNVLKLISNAGVRVNIASPSCCMNLTLQLWRECLAVA